MNLAIDIGNTHIKAAVFEEDQLVETFKAKGADPAVVEAAFAAYPGIGRVIIAATGEDSVEVEEAVRKHTGRVIRFVRQTPVPIKNTYATPQTLGRDRLAAAVGANAIYPENDVLIFDFGTAITIDIVTREGEFLGGNISPGVQSRFRALHDYTARLPLLAMPDDPQAEIPLVAATTDDALTSGVINGIQFEIEGYIEQLSGRYDSLKIIFTGGDGIFFAKRLKNTIFATYDLVVHGLNRILEYNAD